jgi:MoxR-like ATPase
VTLDSPARPNQSGISRRRRLTETRSRAAAHVIGRDRELDLVVAAVSAGRDLLLEGPPGTSKTTLLRAITAEWGIPLVFVEGNADLTPTRLTGHHNPARVLKEDYTTDNFVDGPLLQAMREGGFLYIEEFNRAPDDTLNTLLTAMAERSITVPRVGRIEARSTFRVIASMNPYDNIGTTRLSSSVSDRLCRLAIDYQDAAAEARIVALRAPLDDLDLAQELIEAVRRDAVELVRSTRDHTDIHQGSSVRGAIDLALVAGEILTLRGIDHLEASESGSRSRVAGPYAHAILDAMIVSLSGRIHLDQTVGLSPEEVLREIWQDYFLLRGAAAAPG